MKNILLFLFLITFSTWTIHAQTLVLNELCDLPQVVLESSGLEVGPDGCFWTHNDSGNPAGLYCVDTTGTVQRTVEVVGDPNTDWEDLAKDDEGNLYIGNFGNNSLNRTDLRIVKVPSIDTCTATTFVTDTIRFSYPDQTAIPPTGGYGNFDMEAFFWHQDSLHLFSKDRSDPSTGYTKHYTLPAIGGTYQAQLNDSLFNGTGSFIFSITGADISDDGQSVVLIKSDRIWLLTNYNGTDFFGGDAAEIALGSFSQKEGVCFRDGFIYFTDEEVLGFGGKMYRVHPSVFVGLDEANQNLVLTTVYTKDYRLDYLQLPAGERFSWKLYSTSGQLIQEGTETIRLNGTDINATNGAFVLKVRTESTEKSLLIKL